MARIVIDARESGTSSGRYVDKLIEYLYKLQPRHEFVLLAKPHRMAYLSALAPTFTCVESPFKEFTFAEQLGLKRQIDSLKADLVHFPFAQQPVRYSGATVTTIQDLTTLRFRNPAKNSLGFWCKQQVYRWVNIRVAKKSRQVIAISDFVKQDIINLSGIAADKITVTYEAADYIRDLAEPVLAVNNKKFIMYVGRPTPHKNLRRLIDAFALLQKDRPDLHLVLAGKKDANYENHAQYIAENGIPNTIFTGFISEGQLKWLYEQCMAYVFPSLSEGFGLPGLEAMIHGAPVISSDASCLPEVHGNGAYYFNPLDVTDIAAKIGAVLDDPVLRADLIQKGAAQAAKYSWKRMAEQTLAVYEQARFKLS